MSKALRSYDIINPLNLILYSVSYYYVLMASINDGFSSFSLGVPYAIILLLDILYYGKGRNFKYLHIFIIAIAIIFVVLDRSKCQLLYPLVGKTYTITNDVYYSYSDFSIDEIEIYDTPHGNYLDEQKPIFKLISGDSFYIESQIVTGHADFGIDYTFKIKSKSFYILNDYISKNLEKIKTEAGQNFNSKESNSYFKEEKQFYITDHELITLMKTQELPFKKQNIESIFTFMTFFYMVYPIIFILFILVLAFRNNMISRHKNLETVAKINQE